MPSKVQLLKGAVKLVVLYARNAAPGVLVNPNWNVRLDCTKEAVNRGGSDATMMGASANTVPVNPVNAGVLSGPSRTLKRPPETVPSRLSVVSLAGRLPPLLRTTLQFAPSQ